MLIETPVIEYERPLEPGGVRISHGARGAVAIKIAPDTAKRAVLKIGREAAVAAVVATILLYAGFAPPGTAAGWLAVLAAVVVVVGMGWRAYRVLGRSGEPILFRADAGGLRVRNALEAPVEAFYAASDVVAVQLRRVSVLTEGKCFQLEVIHRSLAGDDASRMLLVSGSFETLDKIGRTLCAAMEFPAPAAVDGVAEGWWSRRPGAVGLQRARASSN
jgi:hypothetical protein